MNWKIGDKVCMKPGHPYSFFDRRGELRRGELEEGVIVEPLEGHRFAVQCPNGQVLGFTREELDSHDLVIVSNLVLDAKGAWVFNHPEEAEYA